MTRLRCAKQIAGAPELEISQGNPIPRPELGMMFEHLEPTFGIGIDQIGHEEITVCAPMSPSDSAAQLIQLGQPELVRPVDDHRIGVGHIEPGLDNHRRYQNVDVTCDKLTHVVVEVTLALLPVRHRDRRAWRQTTRPVGHSLDRFNAIVHQEHLSPAIQLTRNGLGKEIVVPRLNEREHRRPISGWRLDGREISETRKCPLQRSGNRCGGERQHIHFQSESLEALLVSHTEAVLFIDHQKTEVLEVHIRRQQAMGADDDVDRPTLGFLQHVPLFGRRAKPRQHFGLHGEVG